MSRISRKELKRDEFVEATKGAEHWLEEHWRVVAIIVAAVAVVGLIVGAWFWFASMNRERAKELLAEGLQHYDQAQTGGFGDMSELEAALTAFDKAAGKGGGSVSLLARYYSGATLYRLNRDEDARAALERVVDSPDAPPTIAGSARALLADVYVALGERERAIEVLRGLVDSDPPTYPVDQALLALGKLYRDEGDMTRARECWQRIVNEFPVRGSVAEARRLLGS